MDNSSFKAKRISRTYRQAINASAQRVFPLLCPVREAEWLDGWRCTMLYSESGLAELGAVFSTSQKGEADTIWVISAYDPDKYRIQFVRFTHQSRTCILDIAVRHKDAGGSYVDISYTYTAVSPEGNDFIEEFTEEAFLKAVTFWEQSMNYFLDTSKQLKSDA